MSAEDYQRGVEHAIAKVRRPEEPSMTTQPTLNPECNETLSPSDPVCEECSRDLTGRPVVDIGWALVCEDCAEIGDNDMYPSEFELRQAERKQLGL